MKPLPSITPEMYRWGRAICAAVGFWQMAACKEAAAPERTTELTVNVSVPLLTTAGAAGIIASGGELVVGQTRSDGAFQSYGRATLSSTSFGQVVPVSTKLNCGSLISCTVSVRLRLAAGGSPFDSADVGPFTMSGGQTPSVSGFEFRRVVRLQMLDSALLSPIGQPQPLRIRLLDASGAVLSGRVVSYSSSDASVAAVDAEGRVTGVRPGRAIITAVREGLSGTATITVNAVESLTLTASAARVIATVPLRLTASLVVPAGTNRRVLFRTSDPSIATVDTAGVVTTRSDGTVIFTALAEVDTTQRRTVSVVVDPYRAATSWRYQIAAERGPFSENIQGVWGLRSDSVYAITCGGLVNRWDGTAWRAAGSAIGGCPRSIAGTSVRNIIAVGSQIWRFDGTTWARENVTQPATLEWVTAAEQIVYAVGNSGLIMRRDQTSWSIMPSGTTRNIRTVSAWSASDVWAAGDGRTVLRLVNGAWAPAPELPSTVTDCVGTYVRGPRDVFVNCFENGFGWATFRWDGTNWSRLETESRQIYRAFFPIGNVLYAVGEEGMVMRLDQLTWRIDSPSVGEGRMTGGFGDANGAIVAGNNGVSYARRNGRWELVSSVPTYQGIWGDASGILFGVGVQGAIDRYDGTRWSASRPAGGQALRAVWGASPTAVFASGHAGTMLRFDGIAWRSLVTPTTRLIPGVWGVNADSVWAVTDNGEILFFNGESWRLQFRTGRGLRGVHGLNARNVWAVGDEGRIWKFDGRAWAREESNTEANLQSVLAVGDRTFAVGGTELLERRDGEWRTSASFAGTNFFLLAGTSPRDVYAAGCGTTFRRFDGTTWNVEVPTNVTTCVGSAFALPNGGVVLGGFFRDLVVGTSATGFTPGVPR